MTAFTCEGITPHNSDQRVCDCLCVTALHLVRMGAQGVRLEGGRPPRRPTSEGTGHLALQREVPARCRRCCFLLNGVSACDGLEYGVVVALKFARCAGAENCGVTHGRQAAAG